MSRPACANPANIRHVVKPSESGERGRYCYQQCVCGDIVSFASDCDTAVHPPHEGGCDCEVTPVFCIDCDTEFIPIDPDDDTCAACIARVGNGA